MDMAPSYDQINVVDNQVSDETSKEGVVVEESDLSEPMNVVSEPGSVAEKIEEVQDIEQAEAMLSLGKPVDEIIPAPPVPSSSSSTAAATNELSDPSGSESDPQHAAPVSNEHVQAPLSVEKPTVELEQDTAPSSSSAACLKGKMTYEGGNVTCKGAWGMSDLAHTQPGQTSDFQFKLIKADEESSGVFPINGKYQGWFHLKQAAPTKSALKIEDKEMMIKFEPGSTEGQHTIAGSGVNKFGSFTLKGTLSLDGDLHVYREYYNLTPVPVPTTGKRRLSGGTAGGEGAAASAGTWRSRRCRRRPADQSSGDGAHPQTLYV
eukprot:CAMPEP_0181347054 /NCGR_PEP_ID=MMETSP1101-20121128/33671_1 /TAXON_ID=46948 /ORGANISM="Rhodomonas abbreviata, Strain Caron Lab Isolate" /LENGTH=319 /DNA_ID=CAMNT_0023459237 /DNA_START=68 /DNA_END=1025 /DNA_ORIENTATION=-